MDRLGTVPVFSWNWMHVIEKDKYIFVFIVFYIPFIQACPFLDLLPDNLLRLVCSFVGPPVDKVNLLMTCHRMQQVVEHRDSWAHQMSFALGGEVHIVDGPGWCLTTPMFTFVSMRTLTIKMISQVLCVTWWVVRHFHQKHSKQDIIYTKSKRVKYIHFFATVFCEHPNIRQKYPSFRMRKCSRQSDRWRPTGQVHHRLQRTAQVGTVI